MKVTHWQLETKSRDVASMVAQSVQWRLAEGVNGKMDRTRLEAAARAREVRGRRDKSLRCCIRARGPWDSCCFCDCSVTWCLPPLKYISSCYLGLCLIL
jgi:hypothetical protein